MITVSYSGDANYFSETGASTAFGQTVQDPSKVNSTTTVTLGTNPSYAGQALTLTATVAGSGPLPSGTVTFYNGASSLGTVTLANVAGAAQASLTTSSLLPGPDEITAVYNGSTIYNTSTSTLTQTVTAAQTSLALSSTPNSSAVGQTITVSAVLSSTMPSGGPVPTGTITLLNGTTQVGSLNVAGATGGEVTFSIPYLAPGTYTFTAQYSGDSNYLAASQTSTQTVTKGAPGAAVTSARNPAPSGKPVTLTATVNGRRRR